MSWRSNGPAGTVGLAAAAAIVIGSLALTGRTPTDTPPAAATQQPASGAHLSLPVPPAASVAPSAIAPAASGALTGAPASAAAFDSRGFAPLVQRALDSGDPKDALAAVQWMGHCLPDQDVESMLNGSHPKYRIQVSDEVRRQWIENVRQSERQCQTVTPDLMAHYKTLAQRALDAQLTGAGLAYFQALDRENRSDPERARALVGLRADAEQGVVLAVPILARSTLGQSRTEQLAYQKLTELLVQRELLPPMLVALPPGDAALPAYSPQEQADATALVRRLWPRFQKPG